ncbi:beta-lactamase family protein [Luteimonas sp. XNQY3]|nr:serine hydrolase domain-containing protein [Luteimonas sp. XNQY3]MCD9005713.1 beta-lactamase family protein [Luteimonas sp. XNQY3]
MHTPVPHSRCRTWIAAVVLLAAGTVQAAPATDPPRGWAPLVADFERLLERDGVVGGSIGLVEDGRLVDRRDYGFADRTAGRRVDGDTVFHWASITKTINAITVMQLVEQGRLTLGDPIVRHIPELRRMHNPYGAMDAITVGMLLSHTAGFQGPTWPWRSGAEWEPFEPTDWEQIVAMLPYQRIESRPGSQYGYSNPSWIHLARMVERMSGEGWQYRVQKQVFAPLGMDRSYFGLTPPHLKAHRSRRYLVQRDATGAAALRELDGEFDPGITIPNGGWNAPLADAATYVGFLTGAPRGDAGLRRRHDSVLSRETLARMWEPRIAVSDAPDAERVGLGFFVSGEGAGRVVGHTGGQGGFLSFLYFNPETGRGVVAAFNTARPEAQDGRPGFFQALRHSAIEVLR